MYNILDVVANHVGYGSNVNLPAFNPFYEPAYFHDCTGGWAGGWAGGRAGGLAGERRAGGLVVHVHFSPAPWGFEQMAWCCTSCTARTARCIAGCGPYCQIPTTNPSYRQQWDCFLSGLPDLNQSLPFVRDQLANWIKWMLPQFR